MTRRAPPATERAGVREGHPDGAPLPPASPAALSEPPRPLALPRHGHLLSAAAQTTQTPRPRPSCSGQPHARGRSCTSAAGALWDEEPPPRQATRGPECAATRPDAPPSAWEEGFEPKSSCGGSDKVRSALGVGREPLWRPSRRRAGHEAISFFWEDPAFGASPRVPRAHEVWIRTQAPGRTTPRRSPVSVPGSARLCPLHRLPVPCTAGLRRCF